MVAERVAVPETTGQVDPLQWLPESQAAVVAHLPEIMLALRSEVSLWFLAMGLPLRKKPA